MHIIRPHTALYSALRSQQHLTRLQQAPARLIGNTRWRRFYCSAATNNRNRLGQLRGKASAIAVRGYSGSNGGKQHTFAPHTPSVEGCDCSNLPSIKHRAQTIVRGRNPEASANMLHNGQCNNNCQAATASDSKSECLCANVLSEIIDKQTVNDATGSEQQRPLRFAPKRVLILTKVTRLEFERRTNPQCTTEEELKQLLVDRGSDYKHLRDRHNYHHAFVDCVVNELKAHDIEHRVVQRFDYTDDAVNWADVIFTAGGDGTFLLAASRLFDPDKPLIGINTDPAGSEGYMCLMNKLSYEYFPSAFKRLLAGDFSWMWRQRIRISLVGPDAWSDPIELHDQQMLHPELRWLDHIHEAEEANFSSNDSGTTSPALSRNTSGRGQRTQSMSGNAPRVLPYLALNEVFMGESVSSRKKRKAKVYCVSYFELKLDDDARMLKQKNSGITVCTGTGSTSWYFNINRISNRCLAQIMRILSEESKVKLDDGDKALVERVTKRFNDQLIFDPAEIKMAYTIRDPVSNATFKCERPRGFAQVVEVKSRCFDAHLVIDGGMSFAFNTGSRALLEIRPRDALRTVTFR